MDLAVADYTVSVVRFIGLKDHQQKINYFFSIQFQLLFGRTSFLFTMRVRPYARPSMINNNKYRRY